MKSSRLYFASNRSTSLSAAVRRETAVCAARSTSGNGAVRLWIGTIRLLSLIGVLTFCSINLFAVNYTANVYAPSQQLQKQFIADTTTQYQATVATSPFANTFTITLSARYPSFQGPVQVSTSLVTLDSIVNKLTTISTYTYVTGFANGMEYERYNNAALLGHFMMLCSTANAHDFTICNTILGFSSDYILNQTSGIVVVPNPPLGF